VKAKPAASNKIPIADIAVRVLRAAGLARNLDALCTAIINVVYQDVETVACTQERMNIPHPKLKCLGTNWGINATAKTAALTLVRLVNRPSRYAANEEVFASESKSNFPNSLRNCHSVCIANPQRKITPKYFRIENARCDLANIAESPTPESAPQINSPVEFPKTDRKAARRPPTRD